MTTQEMLEALGLRTPPPASSTLLPSIALFSAGLLTGAAAAILLAPKPGREIRRDVAHQASKLQQTVRNRGLPAIHEEEVGAHPPSRKGPDYSASPSRRR